MVLSIIDGSRCLQQIKLTIYKLEQIFIDLVIYIHINVNAGNKIYQIRARAQALRDK